MSEQVKLLCIPPELIDQVWPKVVGMVDSGYAAGDENMPPNIIEALTTKKMLLWVALEGHHAVAAMTTELYEGRSGLHCFITACGGDRLFAWQHLMEQIETYARAEGCVKIRAAGRRGWLRSLNGFSSDRVVFEKRL